MQATSNVMDDSHVITRSKLGHITYIATWKRSLLVWPWPYSSRPLPDTPLVNYEGEEADPTLPHQSLPLMATLNKVEIDPQASCPLFRLSPEIREYIFRLTLQTYCHPDKPHDRKRNQWRPDQTGRRHIDTALLRTCRAVYRETWALPITLTSLVVHEGDDEDRAIAGRSLELLYIRPAQPLFHLQAWQVLLLQHMDLTFSQERYETRGIEDWVMRLDDSRMRARSIVLNLAEAMGPDTHAMREFIVRSLLSSSLKTVTVRINRCDWWAWQVDPVQANLPGVDHPARGRLRPALDIKLPARAPWFTSSKYPDLDDMFARDFELRFVLESFGKKAAQLDQVAQKVAQWRPEAPMLRRQDARQLRREQQQGGGGSGGGGANGRRQKAKMKRYMLWDGNTRAETWLRHIPEALPWLRREPDHELARRIEKRVVRLVARSVKKEDVQKWNEKIKE